MINTCIKCGDHSWNKLVTDKYVTCARCGHSWPYVRLPLFILSGCSGVGKTTTGIQLMSKQTLVTVLDADIFCGIAPASTADDYKRRIDTLTAIARNINQSGRPTLWTVAGNLDLLPDCYNSQFFSEIHCLALVTDRESLVKRMTEGRGITDRAWIDGSVEYNEYLASHNSIGKLSYDRLNITGLSPESVSVGVLEWIQAKLIDVN